MYYNEAKKQHIKLENLNKSLETVEIAVIGLNDKVDKVKAVGTDKITAKISELGEQHINPLIDEMINQQKVTESLVREFNRTQVENRSLAL